MRALGVPLLVIVAGLELWVAGLSTATAPDEWLVQAVCTTIWLATLEWAYGGMLAATTGGTSRSSAALGAARSWRGRLWLVAGVAVLVPLVVVAEVGAQWVVNRVLYQPGHADLVFFGWMRGLIDGAGQATHMATTDEPLSSFTRGVLGWGDETHPFALVVCACLFGDVAWASLAMTIGTGVLRHRHPRFARAFRLAALQAATAPVVTLAYFFLRGGNGVSAWSGVLAALVGTMNAGAQVPMWVRLLGVSIFFGLPILIVGWRLRADRRVLGTDTEIGPVRHAAPDQGRGMAHRIAVGAVVPLLAIWGLYFSPGPWSWIGQSVWLALWLGTLAACHDAVVRLTPEWRAVAVSSARGARYAAELVRLVLLAWPLAVAGLVVQVVAQCLVVGAEPQFFGWFLGQPHLDRLAGGLPPSAIAAAFLGNVLWAGVLLGLARRAWRERSDRTARGLSLGALQTATAPLALCAFMLLSIITRDRAAPGVPDYDVWHVWTYVGRAAVDASFATEVVPVWLSLLGVVLLLGLPLVVARASFTAECAALRHHAEATRRSPSRRASRHGDDASLGEGVPRAARSGSA